MTQAAHEGGRKRAGKAGAILKVIAINLLITLALLEIASFILIESGAIASRKPPYSMKYSIESFWGDVDEHFGVWHPANIRFRHIRNCYDLVYSSNSYGARDLERQRRSSVPRAVVLGDSFVEGMGVERQDRLSERLEEKTGIEHLTFGTSGNFGHVQEYLLYKHLAKEFDHEIVILGILPDNDFQYMYPDRFQDRFYPYLAGEYPDYQLKTTLASVEESNWNPRKMDKTILKRFLLNYTYSRNLYDYIGSLLDAGKMRDAAQTANKESGSPFVAYKEADWYKMRYSFEKIVEEAAGKKVLFFTIPRINDLHWYREDGISALGEALSAWAASYPNVYILDLLPLVVERVPFEEWGELFIYCDGHWSEKGHEIGAQLILEHIAAEIYP